MPAGRPTDYKEEYNEQAYKLCLLGATDAQVADFLGIAESTLNNWKHAHPKFMESLKRGKIQADAEVAEALFHRAKGYSHQEDKILSVKDENGEPLIVPTIKHYPPDTAAAFIWLKNRTKYLGENQWKDKTETETTINGLDSFLSAISSSTKPPNERS